MEKMTLQSRFFRVAGWFLLFFLVGDGESQYSQYGTVEQSILNENLASSRAIAMGGAFTALADDGAAVVWNPAGLTQCNRLGLGSCGDISFSNISVTLPTTLSAQKYRVVSQGTLDLQYAVLTVPVMKNRPKWTFGVALLNMVPLQQRTTTILKNPTASWSDKVEAKRDGEIYALSFGMGLSIIPQLSIGITAANLFGTQQTDSTITYISVNFERLRNAQQTNHFSGNFLRLGILWQPHPQFRLGSCVTLPHELELTHRRYGDPVAMIDSAKLFMIKPVHFTTGLCWVLSKNFLFTFDYHYRPWQQVRLKGENFSIKKRFNNAHSFHMGSEFTYDVTYYRFAWRFGFFMRPEQISEQAREGGEHPISSHFFTTGIGILTNIFIFDISLVYQNVQYKAPTLVEDAELADVTEHNYRVLFGLCIFIN